MFKAIVSGKAGTSSGNISAGTSWSKAFQVSEDLLTATVFERLAYLDGSTLWQILKATFPLLPHYRIADLLEVQFWPRLEAGNSGTGQIEPDLILQFEVGDPPKRIDLLLEAKLGGAQNAGQWLREWSAHQAALAQSDTEVDAYLLAIGGVGSSASRTLKVLGKELEQMAPSISAPKVDAAGWQKLADVVGDVKPSSLSQARILEDVVEALALFGFRHLSGLNPLLMSTTSHSFAKSIASLQRL